MLPNACDGNESVPGARVILVAPVEVATVSAVEMVWVRVVEAPVTAI